MAKLAKKVMKAKTTKGVIKPSILLLLALAPVLSTSCAPSDAEAYGTGQSASRSASSKIIDPRFVGTWVSGNVGNSHCVVSFFPSGKGTATLRRSGKFQDRNFRWQMKGGILEVDANWKIFTWNEAEESNPFLPSKNDKHLALSQDFVLWPNNNWSGRYSYGSYSSFRYSGTQNQAVGKLRLNIIGFGTNKMITSDLRSPSTKSTYFKYSSTPTKDPYSAYAWFDRGGYKQSN